MTTTLNYADVRRTIANEKVARIRAHQANVAAVTRTALTLAQGQQSTLNLIAQGDSWFDYPLPVPTLDQSDIIAHLKNLPAMAPEILSLAHYGETTEDMLGVVKYKELFDNLADQSNGKFDAILFSGGGNDLAGNQFRLWLNDAGSVSFNSTSALITNRVNAILEVIKAGYIDLIEGRNKIDQKIPIFSHSYDFAIPNGVPAPCGIGPWLQPSFASRGWNNLAAGKDIVRMLLEQFASLLDLLAACPSNNFVHVHTQRTLSFGQWANELHPTPDGFAAITGMFVTALRARFPGRI